MRNCLKCGEVVPNRVIIKEKTYNLQRRKFCFKCSPFKKHNTRQLHISKEKSIFSFDYKDLTPSQRKIVNKKYYEQCLKKRRDKRKKQLVLRYGGECSKCGYNNNLSNLCFHHKDPSTKLFEINAHSIASKPMIKLIKEADKCELLCFHCHNDLHYSYGLTWKEWDIQDSNL